MYSSIGLCGLACACAARQTWVWLALVALLLILLTKALLEERWMTQQHTAYADYQARTRRFLPWLL
jgi:protein-S-isoprenylcysteine O-methyltransferase Ste14